MRSYVLSLVSLSLVLTVALPMPAKATTTVTANYSVNNGVGSPYVFGTNNFSTTTADLNSYLSAGCDIDRNDLAIENIVPNTTVATYKAGIGVPGSVADPTTWNFGAWDNLAPQFFSRGVKVIAIMDYCPTWLSYSGDNHGVPTDWTVYKDIVTKVYQHCKTSISYVEVWNEPDVQFLSLVNAPSGTYPDHLTAYTAIYTNVASAIRAVDSSVPIGGPALGDPSNYTYTPSWVTSLLANPTIAPNFNFISYHHYNNSTANYTGEFVQNYAAIAGASNLPIFVDEWNYSYDYNQIPLDGASPDAISYAGVRLTNLFEARAFASLMFSDNTGNFPFFDSNGNLEPKGSTYRLLAVDLGLGTGNSTIAGTTSTAEASSAINSRGDKTVWIVNDGTSAVVTNFTLSNLGGGSTIVDRLFEASPNNDASQYYDSQTLAVSGGTATVNNIYVPAKSVVGMTLNSYTNPNLLANGGLETGSQWTGAGSWGTHSVVANNQQHSGQYAALVTGASGVEQVVSGLQPNTTYQLSGWVKKATANSDATYMSVLNYGGTETGYSFTTTSYTQGVVTFTTGATNTSATVSFYNGGSATSAYGDDFILCVSSTTAPPAPTGLGATAGNGQVALSWTASSGATSYNVYRGTSSGGESTTAIATGIAGLSYTNTGLTNGTHYYFKVAAVNTVGTSGYSNEASATPAGPPAAPTGLAAVPGNAQISLSWSASSGATSYRVYRGTTAGGESTTAVATGITTTSYTNTGLTNSTTYYYKVAAVNAVGTSGYSNEATTTPYTPIVESATLTLNKYSVSHAGGSVTANVTLKNVSGSSITLSAIDVAARDQSNGNRDFGGAGTTTLTAGQTVTINPTRNFTTSDPTGNWTVFLSYETADGVWHPLSPTLGLMVAN